MSFKFYITIKTSFFFLSIFALNSDEYFYIGILLLAEGDWKQKVSEQNHSFLGTKAFFVFNWWISNNQEY